LKEHPATNGTDLRQTGGKTCAEFVSGVPQKRKGDVEKEK
jgi:hypothetical protein